MEPMLQGAAPQAAPADLVKDSDQTKFAKDVLEASRTVPVIVDFWAPWCGPCKQLQPTIEKVVKEAKGAVKLVKINIDQNQMLAQQLRIQSIPAVYAFFGGRPVDGFMGAVPESQVKQFVDRLVQAVGGAAGEGGGNEIAELLEHAKAATAQNDFELAARIYSEVLGVEPANVAALAGMARYQVQIGDLDQAKALLEQIPAKDRTGAEVAAVQAAIDLAE
jgi:putative thioredoxin